MDQWILCSERLPRNWQTVLIYAEDQRTCSGRSLVTVAKCNRGFWFFIGDDGNFRYPTHISDIYTIIKWQPLPPVEKWNDSVR